MAGVLLLALTACTVQPIAPSGATPTSDRAPTAASNSNGAPSQVSAASFTPTPVAVATVSAALKTIADLGFRPDINGFSFQNYSNAKGYQNLTVDEMQRIFGDEICASRALGKCILTPPGRELMQQYNRAMNAGHCFGFSVLALRFAQQQVRPADFGANTVAELRIEGNDKLQREIAYSHAFQFFDPVQGSAVEGTPNEVLDKLIADFRTEPGRRESYTIGFFNAQGGGGHAVTPYAVAERGSGQFAVLVYDNNLPATERAILFDRTANTWTYTASVNPNVVRSQYTGDAQSKSLFLFPTSPGLQKQTCSTCHARLSRPANGVAAPATTYNEIFLDGNPETHAHLLLSDDQGRRYGYLPDGRFVREIPGVKHSNVFTDDLWQNAPEPTYYVPTGVKFTLTIDGSALTDPDVTAVVMIGPGYDLGIESIQLMPGQKDTLNVASDGSELSYHTDSAEAPDFIVGIETNAADYEFTLTGLTMTGGGTLVLGLAKGQLDLHLEDNQTPATFALAVDKIDAAGEQLFEHAGITLDSGDTQYVDYAGWTGNKAPMQIEIDRGSNGTIDQVDQETDQVP